MRRASSKWWIAIVVAVGVLAACAAAHAYPARVEAWFDLLGQSTGGSFGGSSWGSGGGHSSGGSSGGGSSSSGGGGDGIVDFIVTLLLQILFHLLWELFVWCLTQYPAPTVAVFAILGVFLWAFNADRAKPSPDGSVDAEAPRGREFDARDAAVIADLARAMELVSGAGLGLSAALALGAVVTCVRHAHAAAGFFAGLAGGGVGVAVAVASWHVAGAAAAFRRTVETSGSDMDHAASAVGRLGELFGWIGKVLTVTIVALVVLVMVGFSLGG